MRLVAYILRVLGLLALSTMAVAIGLVLCELAARTFDGLPLMAWRLPPAPYIPAPPRKLDPAIAGRVLADVDPAWIEAAPPPQTRRPRVDRKLVARSREAVRRGAKPFDVFRVWNRRFVEQIGCKPGNDFRILPQPLLVFDPSEPTPYPTYRYPPSSSFGGLVTNSLGWRGPDVPLDKPPGTIRLAFAGASTTVGMYELPFSYPEYVVHWLNLWAERNAPGVRFDGINAGREGLSSVPIAAVIRQELLPMEPDLVLYYEGANESLCVRAVIPSPPPPSLIRGAIDRFVTAVSPHSAIGRRLQAIALVLDAQGGYEPEKPPSDWRLPAGLDEMHPDLAKLPPRLKLILDQLESARRPLEQDGVELALSSFVWLVFKGLWLDPQKYLPAYRHLNEACWPFRYEEIRRSLDLHNRVLEQYAALHGLPFIHVAEAFPPDPSLFFDTMHFTTDGTRLHAWIVFQALVPIVRAHLQSGAWPRPDKTPLSVHPSIGAPKPYTMKCDAQGVTQ